MVTLVFLWNERTYISPFLHASIINHERRSIDELDAVFFSRKVKQTTHTSQHPTATGPKDLRSSDYYNIETGVYTVVVVLGAAATTRLSQRGRGQRGLVVKRGYHVLLPMSFYVKQLMYFGWNSIHFTTTLGIATELEGLRSQSSFFSKRG